MSLKAVHVFFIAVSTLLAVGFGAWELRRYLGAGGGLDLLLSVLAFVTAVALVVYGNWFLKKTKDVSYL